MLGHKEYELRDDVIFNPDSDNNLYLYPFSRDTTSKLFNSVQKAVRGLSIIAESSDDEDYENGFLQARRGFGQLFSLAYEYDSGLKQFQLPTVNNIYTDLNWYDGIPARTFTVHKGRENIVVEYENGFYATNEVITVEKDDEDDLVAHGIASCGEGIQCEHAPHLPASIESWRYNPSKLQFSIQSDDNEKVKLGITSRPASEPFWYRIYKHLSTRNRPYARATFDMDAQTSVIKFTYNQNKPDGEQI